MNDIRPFRGLRFDEQVAGPLNDLLCPPYDVISPAEQQSLYDRNPHNVVRLELGMVHPEDGPDSNRYTRAAATLQAWLSEGVLKADPAPALYLYEQGFSHQGRTVARRGVLARLRLTPWEAGVVLPHEETLAKPKEDRLNLMRATACNLSPVYLLFDDPSRTASAMMDRIADSPPDARAETSDSQTHRLWVVSGAHMDSLKALLETPQLYMADGHHRYETALAYQSEVASRGQAGEDSPHNFVMALLVDAADPGLVVLPTHRLVHGIEDRLIAGLLGALRDRFEVDPVPPGVSSEATGRALVEEMASPAGGRAVLGLYLRGTGAFTLRPRDAQPSMPDRGRPTLDVDLLHDLILEKLLGIGAAELRAGGMVTYTREAAEAVRSVDDGAAQAAFLLNPTRVDQVLETARAGGRMPQKSTYFYPKPETGLVINPLTEVESRR